MAVTFTAAVRTNLGTVRTNNEDSALGSSRLLLLADGMGGHAAGEVASAVATRVFAQLAEPGEGEIGARITHAGRATRVALHEMSDADPLLESMGTTLLVVVSQDDVVTVGHIGDSRVYVLRDDALFQVTTDHTHVQRLVDAGHLAPENVRTHPYRSMLLKSLDDHEAGPDLDLITLDIAPGDRLLMCSDGLSDYLSPEHIGTLLVTPDLTEAANDLVEAALRVGTRDNVTVVVADVAFEAADVWTETDVVGAVTEPLRLSERARRALAESVPGVAALIADPPLLEVADDLMPDTEHSDAPDTETAGEPDTDDPEPSQEQPDQPEPEEESEPDEVSEPEDESEPEEVTATAPRVEDEGEPGELGEPSGESRGGTETSDPVTAAPMGDGVSGDEHGTAAAEADKPQSLVPGALAAGLMVVLAAALVLIL